MAFLSSATVGWLALAGTAVGTGVSVYGQRQAAKTQRAIAEYNAEQQELEARAQFAAMQAQAEVARQQAEANYALAQAQAQAAFANAKQLEDQALSQDAINRSNSRKRADDYERMQSQQRVAIAASGIVESTGTPLDLLAETAARIQQDKDEQHYVNEIERRSIFREADLQRLGGQFALVGATLERDSGLAEAGLRTASAHATARSGRAQAEITRLTGAASERAGNRAAVGTIFSGVNSGIDFATRYEWA